MATTACWRSFCAHVGGVECEVGISEVSVGGGTVVRVGEVSVLLTLKGEGRGGWWIVELCEDYACKRDVSAAAFRFNPSTLITSNRHTEQATVNSTSTLCYTPILHSYRSTHTAW